jgi:hypothetical protein
MPKMGEETKAQLLFSLFSLALFGTAATLKDLQ